MVKFPIPTTFGQSEQIKLNYRAFLFLMFLTGSLLLVIGSIVGFSLTTLSDKAGREQAETAAGMARIALFDNAVHLAENRRERQAQVQQQFLSVPGVRTLRIAPAPKLLRQFNNPASVTADDTDQKVMQDGLPRLTPVSLAGESGIRTTLPVIASAAGRSNCMQCHTAQEGEVLGTLNLVTAGEAQRSGVLAVLVLLALVIAAFVFMITKSLRRIPITAMAVEQAVDRAIQGNFRTPLPAGGVNQMRRISGDLGRLLAFLDLQAKRFEVATSRLTGKAPVAEQNPIVAAADTVETLAHVHAFKQAILQDQNRFEIYQRLGNVLKNQFNISEFSIYEATYNNQGGQLLPVVVNGQRDNTCRWCHGDVTSNAEVCRVYRTCEMVDGVADASLCNAFIQPASGMALRRYMCFPVIRNSAITTILQVITTADQANRLSGVAPFVNLYLNEAATVLENRRLEAVLHDSSLRDPLTGLNNRRFLSEYVETLVANVQRKKSHLTIVMIDLDEFKLVNDDYGVEVGDVVLKGIAKVLKQAVRNSDIVIRYGDDQFLIVLQDPAPGAVDQVAEHIRTSVQNLKVPVTGIALQKTISIGLANFPGDTDTFWQAVRFADLALQRAKQMGRNRFVRFDPAMYSPEPSANRQA